MSSIIKYKRKDGNTYAYESFAKWDSAKRQSRPVRKYLGKVDPITGEIIPTSGRPGRPLGSKNKPQSNSAGDTQGGTQTRSGAESGSSGNSPLETELREMGERIRSMERELEALRKRNGYLEEVLVRIKDQATTIKDQAARACR